MALRFYCRYCKKIILRKRKDIHIGRNGVYWGFCSKAMKAVAMRRINNGG